MIELIDNVTQMILTGACTGIALYFAARSRAREWILLSLFSGIFFLGDLYWALHLAFFQKTPQFSYISDISWDASYLFLIMLMAYINEDMYPKPGTYYNPSGTMPISGSGEQYEPAPPRLHHRPVGRKRWLYLVPVFTGGMCVFYMTRGDLLSNLITAILMTGLLWYTLDGLLTLSEEAAEGRRRSCRILYVVVMVFCLAEYGLWTASCFWTGDTITNVYFWFDFLISFTFLLFPPALRKAVSR